MNHGFMPIEVQVVSKDTFNSWAASKKAELEGKSPEKQIAQTSDQAR